MYITIKPCTKQKGPYSGKWIILGLELGKLKLDCQNWNGRKGLRLPKLNLYEAQVDELKETNANLLKKLK